VLDNAYIGSRHLLHPSGHESSGGVEGNNVRMLERSGELDLAAKPVDTHGCG